MDASSRPRAETEREVWAAVRDCADAHARKRELKQRLHLGVGMGGVRMLLSLQRSGSRSLSELAEQHGVDAPYATNLVNRLTEAGLTVRSEDPADRRRKLVSLTDAGQEAADVARDVLTTPPVVLGKLDDDELAELGRLMAKLREG